MSQTDSTSSSEIRVVRGKFDSLSLYEVTDNELEILEKGSPSSIYLNFAILLLSAGISFLINLLSVNIQSIKTFTVFVVFTVIGILGGIILLVIWYRQRQSMSDIIRKIKQRIPSSEISKEQNSESEG